MTREKQLKVFVECLREGNRRRCLNLIKEWEQQKLSDEQLYEDILIPALIEFGDGWESNELSIVEEHMATQIIKTILSYKAATLTPRRTLRRSAMVGCVPEEHHDVATMLMANTLEADGWQVLHYGGSVPRHDLFESVKRHHPDLLCLTMKSIGCLESTIQLLIDIRATMPDVKILIGGSHFPSVRAILSEYVDVIADTFRDGTEAAARLVNA